MSCPVFLCNRLTTSYYIKKHNLQDAHSHVRNMSLRDRVQRENVSRHILICNRNNIYIIYKKLWRWNT